MCIRDSLHTSGTLVPPGSIEDPAPSTPTIADSPANDARGTLLSALAQIAASLATGEDPTEVLGGVLSRAASAVGAAGVSLWLSEGSELRCEGRAGVAPPAANEVRARLTRAGRGDESMLLVRLDAAHHPMGAIVLAPPPALSPEQHAFLSTVADILAPVLRQAAYAQRLESEVIERTRQIDRERRITERIIDSLPVGLYVIDRDYRVS